MSGYHSISRKLPLLGLLLAFLLVVAACGDTDEVPTTTATTVGTTTTAPITGTTEPGTTVPPPTTTAPTGEKPEIVMSLSDTVNLLEPHAFRSTSAYAVTAALYEPLLRQELGLTADGLLLGSRETHVGAGAESFTIELTDDGGMLATFTLRDDSGFDDGSTVTADDYKYIFQRSIEGPGYIGLLLPFIGIDSADQLTIVDNTTFQIKANVQSPLFERFMTFQVFGAINKDVADANATGDDPWTFTNQFFYDSAAGSGPYFLEEFNPDRQVVLRPNPNYWDAESVANSGVIIRAVPDASERALLVSNGDLDVATGIPPRLVAELENDPNVRIFSAPTSGVQFLGMNQEIAPLDNVNLRKAIVHAVPYQALIDQVLFGYAQPAGGVVTTSMETHDPAIGGQYATDLDAARGFLADSGLTDVKLTFGVRESRQEDQEAAVLIQDSLAQVGIDVEVQVLADADYGARLGDNELPLFIFDWFSWGEDPFYQMTFLTTCGSFVNYARFCNEEFDSLVQEGTFSIDAARRQEISTRTQQIFFDNAVWAPLWSADRTVVTGKCVTGLDRDYTLVPGFRFLTKTDSC